MADIDRDPIEERVSLAFRNTHRDGPEFMELRQAVEAMKADRRRLLKASMSDAWDDWANSMADTMAREADKTAAKVKTFAGDLKAAFTKLGKDE